MTVHMIFTDIKEYNLRSIADLGCNMYSQITMAHVTLSKALLNIVKIFAVYIKRDEFIILSKKLHNQMACKQY